MGSSIGSSRFGNNFKDKLKKKTKTIKELKISTNELNKDEEYTG